MVGAVALLAVVGRITGPEPPAPRPGPAPATTRAPPPRPAPPQRGVTARIEVGHGGGPLLFGAGGLWVGAWRDREVVRIDPRSNRVGARFPVGCRDPFGLAVDAGTIWVAQPDTDEVVRLDLGTGREVARVRLGPLPFEVAPGDRRFRPSLVAVGAGAGWVATRRGAVARVDAASNRVVAVIRLPQPGSAGIVVAGHVVWVAQGHGLTRIDAASNRLLGTVRLRLRPCLSRLVYQPGVELQFSGPQNPRCVEQHADALPGRCAAPLPEIAVCQFYGAIREVEDAA